MDICTWERKERGKLFWLWEEILFFGEGMHWRKEREKGVFFWGDSGIVLRRSTKGGTGSTHPHLIWSRAILLKDWFFQVWSCEICILSSLYDPKYYSASPGVILLIVVEIWDWSFFCRIYLSMMYALFWLLFLVFLISIVNGWWRGLSLILISKNRSLILWYPHLFF